jgi:hypothetical protein
MRAVTVPASAGDRVAALRIEALHTTNRIVAALGAPLVLCAAWSVSSERPGIAMAAVIGAACIALPVALPARVVTIRRVIPVVGLAWTSALSWIMNGAFSLTGLLMWTTGIVAAGSVRDIQSAWTSERSSRNLTT